jgi:pimeloyl-ACP methyl ester carboxylesterase
MGALDPFAALLPARMQNRERTCKDASPRKRTYRPSEGSLGSGSLSRAPDVSVPAAPSLHPSTGKIDMKPVKACLAIAVLFSLTSAAAPARAEPLRNIVLVHGAWVDASGWKPVYDLLTKDGFKVTMVQEPETSFADDVTATKRILDMQDGPTLLVGHSYGGSVITEAGVHPNVAGLVYVAAHAPDVGENESALGKTMPSVLAKTEGAIKTTPDTFTYLAEPDFLKLFAPDLPRERAEFSARSQVLAAAAMFGTPLTAAAWKTKPSWGIVAGSDQIINPDLERWYYERAKSRTIEIKGASHSVYESHPTEVAS